MINVLYQCLETKQEANWHLSSNLKLRKPRPNYIQKSDTFSLMIDLTLRLDELTTMNSQFSLLTYFAKMRHRISNLKNVDETQNICLNFTELRRSYQTDH